MKWHPLLTRRIWERRRRERRGACDPSIIPTDEQVAVEQEEQEDMRRRLRHIFYELDIIKRQH